MPTPPISLSEAQRTIEAIEDLLRKGNRPPGMTGQGYGAIYAAADILGLKRTSIPGRLRGIKRVHGLEPNWSLYVAPQKPETVIHMPAPPPGSDVDMAQQGWAPEHDLVHEVPEGLTLKGTSIRYDGAGNVDQYWNKTKAQGRLPDEVTQLPDPKRIVKVSTLYDQAGRVTQQWVAEKPEEVQREALWRAFGEEIAKSLPRAEPVEFHDHPSDSLAACFPIGDHHVGMLSWGEETGANYDLKIAERLLTRATDYLMSATAACSVALIAVLGDFAHTDGIKALTPTSGNLLDVDGRLQKMVRVIIRSIRYTIDAALRKHAKVHVIVEIGNHDPSMAVFLAECLANIYENEPRIFIDTSPSHFHYFEFGSCLVGTHHGDGAKMEKLPLIMAADRPEAWGRTKYRYWWTGHIHNQQVKDFEGVSVESFRVLPPVDAWAAGKGYRSARDMKAIILHKDFGEVARHIVNPAMLEAL